MKIMNRISKGLICILALFMVIPISISASGISKVNIEGYHLQENNMSIYINLNTDISFTAENVQAYLGDQSFEIQSLRSFSKVQEGVSYLVLVDVSGSVTTNDIVNTKEVLTELINLMIEDDNMSIVEIINRSEELLVG